MNDRKQHGCFKHNTQYTVVILLLDSRILFSRMQSTDSCLHCIANFIFFLLHNCDDNSTVFFFFFFFVVFGFFYDTLSTNDWFESVSIGYMDAIRL